MSEELITIAQAAVCLHVSERTLRRVLSRPDQQANLVAMTRHIRGRTRQVSLINPAHLKSLREQFSVHDQQADEPTAAGNTPADPARIYERLLEEQAARISDLQVALEYERRQNQRLAEAFSIAQERLSRLSETPKPSVLARLFGGAEKARRRPKRPSAGG